MRLAGDRGWFFAVCFGLVVGCPAGLASAAEPSGAASFTPLTVLSAPAIIGRAEEYPGNRYRAEHLVDGKEETEYSSNGKGKETFVDFDFGRPTRVAAYEHVDRADPANVAAAELVFSESRDFARPIARRSIAHVGKRSGRTFVALAEPVTARYVRWRVTGLGAQGHGTVGGAEIRFYGALEAEAAPSRDRVDLAAWPAIELEQGKPTRRVRVSIDHPYAEATDAVLSVSGIAPRPVRLTPGRQSVEVRLPTSEELQTLNVAIEVAGRKVVERSLPLRPVRAWTIYLLPHSHVDIGFTQVQTEIEKLQHKYLDEALEICQRTASYPEGARFKWNSEVLWAVDSYLRQASPERRARLIAAVKAGQVHLDGLYGNELTGLCRPEELMRLMGCARRLEREYGVTIDSAMISDVPGYTWGLVPAMAQHGIKYFSIGTNHVHRIGHTLEAWADRPFYWVSPSGQEKVLCWVAGKGYSGFHPGLWDRIGKTKPEALLEYVEKLEASGFPYDIVQLRYSIDGDNGPPDPALPDFVKSWNERYVRPKLTIATTHELMQALAQRGAGRIPEVRGDFTPYWEDGAGSTARETALARGAAERLVQAETLFSLLRPEAWPVEDFYQAWRNVLLYNEHTWGAHCSISQPESDFTKSQWKIKQAFAVNADQQSRALVQKALADGGDGAEKSAAVDVFNTTSWERTDLVVLPADGKRSGNLVKDAEGRAVPSQRLTSGALAFLARGVPPLGAKRFHIEQGNASLAGQARAEGAVVENGRIRATIDARTGAIAGLTAAGLAGDLAQAREGFGLNAYFYVAGRDAAKAQGAGTATVEVRERGPLVASLEVRSDAPGCRRLVREVRIVDGLDRVELVNVVDKRLVRTAESVHFGFAPNVPKGVMRMDLPWAVIRPEKDQLPGACKNYFSVGRWIDVSNEGVGLLCATIDAPLAEVGRITVDVSSPFDPKAWIDSLAPTQTFYSYVMNNYWETNYKAEQEGPTTFRYALVPHGPFDPVMAARAGIEASQPLVVASARGQAPPACSLVTVEPSSVLLTACKPAEDGKGLVLRLYNVGERPCRARLVWPGGASGRVVQSSPKEEWGEAAGEAVEMPAHGIVTLRVVR